MLARQALARADRAAVEVGIEAGDLDVLAQIHRAAGEALGRWRMAQ